MTWAREFPFSTQAVQFAFDSMNLGLDVPRSLAPIGQSCYFANCDMIVPGYHSFFDIVAAFCLSQTQTNAAGEKWLINEVLDVLASLEEDGDFAYLTTIRENAPDALALYLDDIFGYGDQLAYEMHADAWRIIEKVANSWIRLYRAIYATMRSEILSQEALMLQTAEQQNRRLSAFDGRTD